MRNNHHLLINCQCSLIIIKTVKHRKIYTFLKFIVTSNYTINTNKSVIKENSLRKIQRRSQLKFSFQSLYKMLKLIILVLLAVVHGTVHEEYDFGSNDTNGDRNGAIEILMADVSETGKPSNETIIVVTNDRPSNSSTTKSQLILSILIVTPSNDSDGELDHNYPLVVSITKNNQGKFGNQASL
jgi:hypothetical protein